MPKKAVPEAEPKKSFAKALPKKSVAKAMPKKYFAKALPKKSVAKAMPKKSVAKAMPKKSAAEAMPKKSIAEARPSNVLSFRDGLSGRCVSLVIDPAGILLSPKQIRAQIMGPLELIKYHKSFLFRKKLVIHCDSAYNSFVYLLVTI
jgi:hypothetical protein